MLNVLIYSDSLSWGIVPNTRARLAFDQRWPGVFEGALNAAGRKVRVIENCLNGRRTVWEDPFKPGRNGLLGLEQVMEMHSPLDLVILMLGTNDLQFCHPHNNAWAAAQGVATLVNAIRRAPIEPGMPVATVLIVSPPPVTRPTGAMVNKFGGAEIRGRGMADAYREVSSAMGCLFFDAGSVARTSAIDGVHVDVDQHRALGEAMASFVDRELPR
jgi:lysophospholipase L1-like esterase